MANKIISLVTYATEGDAWDVTFHPTKKAANAHAAELTYNEGWVVEKLDDITGNDNAMSIDHLNSFIRRYISEENVTEDLADAQNLVWGYLSRGGEPSSTETTTTGTAAPEPAANTPHEQAGQGAETVAQTAKDTRKRPAARKTPATAKAAKTAAKAKSTTKAKSTKTATKKTGARSDSKVAKILSMMRRQSGATVADMAATLDWETKSVHGVISGIIRTKMKLKPTTEKTTKGNVYHLPPAQPD